MTDPVDGLNHHHIVNEDGEGLAFGGETEGEGYWSASAKENFPKKGLSCEDFSKCLKQYFKDLDDRADNGGPYNPVTNNFQGAVRGALNKCGGTTK